jgi:hypothetical protein
MADFFGDDLVREYLLLRGAAPGGRDSLRQHDISLVLLRPDAPLAWELVEDSGWRTFHADDVAILLVRQSL